MAAELECQQSKPKQHLNSLPLREIQANRTRSQQLPAISHDVISSSHQVRMKGGTNLLARGGDAGSVGNKELQRPLLEGSLCAREAKCSFSKQANFQL